MDWWVRSAIVFHLYHRLVSWLWQNHFFSPCKIQTLIPSSPVRGLDPSWWTVLEKSSILPSRGLLLFYTPCALEYSHCLWNSYKIFSLAHNVRGLLDKFGCYLILCNNYDILYCYHDAVNWIILEIYNWQVNISLWQKFRRQTGFWTSHFDVFFSDAQCKQNTPC